MFFMDIKDYIKVFAHTSICMPNDPFKYIHSSLKHRMGTEGTAFFRFKLENAIDCTNKGFGIQLSQQGPRLLKYRSEDHKFEPSVINILLMTEEGTLIKTKDDDDFNQCITSADINTKLEAGYYIVAVNPIWNESASFEEEYKDIVLDIYCPEATTIETIDAKVGYNTLSTAFKNLAESFEAKKFFADKQGYGTDVYRVSIMREVTKCRIGFCYTANNS